MVHGWTMDRDPIVWEEPTRFKLERFEWTKGERKDIKFIPFGMGRRACPGGMRTFMLALGAFIQCFEWDRVGQEIVDMRQGLHLSLLKGKPLEAVCNPYHFIKANVLSQL